MAKSVNAELSVEVCGVGYKVQATAFTATNLGAVNSDVFIYVHHVVREDAQLLYGFTTSDERSTFEALISAHRVGPALALAILDVHRPESLRRVVHEEDVEALCMVPGVGRKTALRLLVELKSKLNLPEADTLPSSTPDGLQSADPVRSDVYTALVNLGYAAEEIKPAMAALPDVGKPQELIRHALRSISNGGRSSGKQHERTEQ